MSKEAVISLLNSGDVKGAIEQYNKDVQESRDAHIRYNAEALHFIKNISDNMKKLRDSIMASNLPEVVEIKDKLIFHDDLTVENLKDNIDSYRSSVNHNKEILVGLIKTAMEKSYT